MEKIIFLKEITPFFMLCLLALVLRITGFSNRSARKVFKGYEKIEIIRNESIFLTIRKKIFFLFPYKCTFRIKYVKPVASDEEVLNYLKEVLQDKKYIIIEIRKVNPFSRLKEASVIVRNCIKEFEKVPIRFLPKTEVKNVAEEMIELGIAELEENDFSTLAEKFLLKNYFKNKKEGEKNEK